MKRPRMLPWRRWTVRSRMVFAVVALAALALLLANLAAVAVLRPYLTQQLDKDLAQLVQHAEKPPRGMRGAEMPRFIPGFGDPAFYLLYNADGTLQQDPVTNLDDADLPTFDVAELSSHAGEAPFEVSGPDGEVFRVQVRTIRGGALAVAGISTDRVDTVITNVLMFSLGASTLVLLGLGFAAHRVVGIGLRPLTRMELAASDIAAGDLTVRVPDTDPHTETGRLGQALNTMLSRIEAAVTARTNSELRLRQFLADASHELRTPLTSIRGFAELYRRGGAPPGPALDDTMSRIESEAARMGLLVEDLLLLAALDEERPLQPSRVDLLAVAADTVRDAHVRSPGRTVELDGFEPITVLGDEHRLRQVVTNLVANALQHTPAEARVTLRLGRTGGAAGSTSHGPMYGGDERAPLRPWGTTTAAEPSVGQPAELRVVAAVGAALAPDQEMAVLEVTDTGPGVPMEHAEHIFERLYRADPHRARSHGGAGLGLAIAAAIVEAHGGRIELATAPGAGATFRVLLPVPDVPNERRALKYPA